MSTITAAQEAAITDTLASMSHIPVGLGDEENACSIAAINLALTGELTDNIPACMSRVIGDWIIAIQDNMPSSIRNSREWRMLLPLAAGTGRDAEWERAAVLVEWMWAVVLPTVQPVADELGCGAEWAVMLGERSEKSARAAANTAYRIARVGGEAAVAGYAVHASANSAAYSARAPKDVRHAYRTAYVARAAATAANTAPAAAWASFNPTGVLRDLIAAGDPA